MPPRLCRSGLLDGGSCAELFVTDSRNGVDSRMNGLFEAVGSDKGAGIGDRHRYGSFYEVILAPRKSRPTRLLELGVSRGASIHVWFQYFDDVEIHGIDVDLGECRLPDDIRSAVSLYEGDVCDPMLVQHVEGFDVIIDDADHTQHTQNQCLSLYWPKLKAGGLYIIEGLFVGKLPWGGQSSPSPMRWIDRPYNGYSAAPDRKYLPKRPQDLAFLNRKGLPEHLFAILDQNNHFLAITNISSNGGLHILLVIQKVAVLNED